jgi:hypothetical protein
MGDACNTHGTAEKYKVLVGKPEERRLLERIGHKWEDNIKMDLGKIGWKIVDKIHLAQDKGPLAVSF